MNDCEEPSSNIAHTNATFGKIVAKYQVTPNQLALNWLLGKPNVMALLKSSNRAHINENLDCMSFTLEDIDRMAIDDWREKNIVSTLSS